MIGQGELSKAVHLLSSNGLGDLADARIIEQLRRKHPARNEPRPDSLEGYAQFQRLSVELGPTFRNLSKQAGTGVSGFRNEYLIALTQNFADIRARQAVPLLEAFANKYINAELQPWFYLASTTVKQIVPIKDAAPSAESAPEVRPLAIGECLRRAIHIYPHQPCNTVQKRSQRSPLATASRSGSARGIEPPGVGHMPSRGAAPGLGRGQA